MKGRAIDTQTQLGTVEQKIRAIVESMNEDVEYIFSNWAQANIRLDKVKSPSIVYILPPSGTLNFTWREVKDRPNSMIAFICNTKFDFDGTENDGIIEEMKRLCIRFVQAFNASKYFDELDGNIPYRVLYDYLDVNVTGIIIEPTLIEKEGVILCREPFKRPEDIFPYHDEDSDNIHDNKDCRIHN